MLGIVQSCALLGIDAFSVQVEVEVSPGQLPSYHVVGLPTPSVKEGAVRIRTALAHVGQAMPKKKVLVNLAPADRRKDGAAFDLPIALGMLVADGLIPRERLADLLILGELGLDGTLRPVRGALAAALLARARGLRGLILPQVSAGEAAEIADLEVFAATDIGQLIAALRSGEPLARVAAPPFVPLAGGALAGDLADVRGQPAARAALEIAVAGGHNLLMVGPPGIGKTMLARRIPTILPPLTRDEALETTKVYSSVGLARGGLISTRPFRAPHHSISPVALTGGSSPPRAGEISLAHHGVLFLDELPEFSRAVLESMRQPLEDREIVIARAAGSICLPAEFMLVASANPCPCGWLGSRDRACTCGATRAERYRDRLSGPLVDRMDLQVFVPQVGLAELRGDQPGESSEAVRGRVIAARERQRHRLASAGMRTNAGMSARVARATCRLSDQAERTLARLFTIRVGMTGRGLDRLIRVARTIADLADVDTIEHDHVLEAAGYRALDALAAPDLRATRPEAAGRALAPQHAGGDE